MWVYNLTDKPINYRGKTIGAYDKDFFPGMTFVPTRDQILSDSKVLAFGALPKGWSKPLPLNTDVSPPPPPPPPTPAPPPSVVRHDEGRQVRSMRRK